MLCCTFHAFLQALPSDGVARAWALPDGTILSVDTGIVNWLGFPVHEMCGSPLDTYLQDQTTQEE